MPQQRDRYKKLWNRDFTLVVTGQVISLFGNAILRFALSLYVLTETGSAAVFATITAFSVIPSILLTPFGGMIADRFNRRSIMVALDFSTGGLVALFALFLGLGGGVAAVAVVLMLLAVIQSFYNPAVFAAIPSLQEGANLERANAVVDQVSMLAGLLGPVLGGLLYGTLGVRFLVAVGSAAFCASAVLELFIRMPFDGRQLTGNLWGTVKGDFGESMHFVVRAQPDIFRTLLSIAAINLFATSLVVVGHPYIINTVLGLDSSLYGYSSGLMAAAGLGGSLLAGLLAGRLRLSRLYRLFVGMGLCLLPMGIGFLLGLSPMAQYWLVTVGVMGGQVCACILSIFLLSAIQRRTPAELLGKVMAFTSTLSMCTLPLGQVAYGFLFDALSARLYLVVFGGAALVCAAGMLSRRPLRSLEAGESGR